MKKIFTLCFLMALVCVKGWGQTALSPTGDGGFETGTTFAANNWSTAQPGIARQWQVGTVAGVQQGVRSAYVGTTSAFNGIAVSTATHIYKDVAIPAGATNVQYSFYYATTVTDPTYDYFYAFTTTTANTPVAGTIPGSGYTLRYSNTSTTYSTYTLIGPFDLTSFAGSTVRLVFTFYSDGFTPNANATIDNVSLTYIPPPVVTNTISGSPFCQGSSVTVPFTAAGTFSAGNVYTAQLSNSSGSFTSPTTIGTLSSTASGNLSITGTIPATATAGTGYRIRVTSSNPSFTSADNGINLTINAPPSISSSPSSQTTCAGTAKTFSVTATGTSPTFQWQYSPDGATWTNVATGTPINMTYSGGTTATLTATPSISAPTGTYNYRCIVSVSGCATPATSAAAIFTVNALPTATIAYNGTPFCSTVTSASPTITGTTGGTFTSTAGLSIDATTGIINPSTSNAGTYTVTYTFSNGTCSNTTTASLTITANSTAAINYAGTPFCTTTASGAVTRTGTTGGTYSSTTGLTISSSTGTITPSSSTPGSYTVTYTVAASGGCAIYTTTTSVTIVAGPSATISYAGTPFCSTVISASPTITGTTGGAFSSTAGLSITSSGVITPSASTAGTYTVTYTVAASGSCAAYNATTSVTITAAPASFTVTNTTPVACSSTIQPLSVITSATLLSEGFETFPTSNFAITGTGVTASSNATYFKTGSKSVWLTAASSTTTSSYASQTDIDLTKLTSAKLTFSHICALEGPTTLFDTGYVEYSTNSGITWTTFPVSSYAGSGTLVNASAIAFSTRSYSDWTSTFSSSTATPTNALWKTETINIPAAALSSSQFRVRYRYATDVSVLYYGWLIDDISVAGSAKVAWAPPTNLYTDAAATIPYAAGTLASTVYVKDVNQTSKADTTIYTASVSNAAGCSTSNTATVITKPATIITSGPTVTNASVCLNANATVSVVATGLGITYQWYSNANNSTSNGTAVPDANGGKLPTANPIINQPTTYFYVVVTGDCGTVTSSVSNAVVSTVTKITSQPQVSQSLCQNGDDTTLTVSTSGNNISYQWYSNTSDSRTGGTRIRSNGTGKDYDPSTATVGTLWYYVVISGECGLDTSNTAKVIVNPPTNIIAGPSTTPQARCQNNSATPLSVSAEGKALTYQWYSSTSSDGSANQILLTGATFSTYQPSTATPGTLYYYVVVTGGCTPMTVTSSVSGPVTVTPTPNATISYAGTPFCTTTASGVVTKTGNGNGTYSTSNGLAIDATTGTITPSGSTPGTYTVTYTVAATGGCSAYTTTAPVTITAAPTATISYAGTPFCSTVVSASPTQTGTAGGSYSSTTGLSITPAGVINPSASTPGNYTVTYTVAASGGCSVYTATAPVTITANPNATISYGTTAYCQTGTASPTRTGTTGGSYSSTTGLVIDASTGVVNLATSVPGTYTVTYTVAATGGCLVYTTTASITVNQTPTASFVTTSYTACSDNAPGVTFSGSANSTIHYTITVQGGTPVSQPPVPINANGDNVTVPAPTGAGTYTYAITSVTLSSGCSGTATNGPITVTINAVPVVAAISGPDFIALSKTGNYTSTTTGGVWAITNDPNNSASITASQSVSSPATATVTASSSNVGTPTLTYTVTNVGCSTTVSKTIQVFNNTIARYRSVQDGKASDETTWEYLNDNGVWINPSPTIPGNSSNIEIRHNVRMEEVNYEGAADASVSITSHNDDGNTVDGTLTIFPQRYFQSQGSVNFGDKLVVLKSDATGTAAIGVMANPIANATNVQVERFTDGKPSEDATGSRRAWRLITSPVTGQTIHEAWQENATLTSTNPNPNYGTLITGEGLTSASDAYLQGYDYIGGGNHTSIKNYSALLNKWVPLSNDGSTTGTKIPLQTEQAYMLFVRGNRTIGASGSSSAILRSTGTLQQGGQRIGLPSTGTYFLLGNPYASAIDFSKFIAHNSNQIKDEFYSWNSTIGTYGSYVLVTHTGTGPNNAGGYSATPVPLIAPGAQNDDDYKYIPNGSGFFVEPKSGATGDITFEENDKAPGKVPTISPFREVDLKNVKELLVNLNLKDSDTSNTLADGFRARFSDDYAGSEEENSNAKAWNFNENLNLVRNGKYHIIEAREDVQKTDTLFVQMWNVIKRNYQLQMRADNFASAAGTQAWLVDNYLGTKQPIGLSGNVMSFDFAVTSDSNSAKTNRFMIVFQNNATVLPIALTNVKATPQNGGVNVSWTVTNEVNVKGYTIEKSTNGGQTFTAVSTQQPARNNAAAALASYNGFDAQPKLGDNLYRIRIEAKDGIVTYSTVVNVTISSNGSGIEIAVYPNPVRDGKVNMQMTNLAAGTYLVSVYASGSGQAVYQRKVTISMPNTTQSEQLILGKGIAQGSYQLRVSDHNGVIIKEKQLVIGR